MGKAIAVAYPTPLKFLLPLFKCSPWALLFPFFLLPCLISRILAAPLPLSTLKIPAKGQKGIKRSQ